MASINDNPLKQLIEAKNSHDIEKMLTFLADDVLIEDVPFGMVMKGKIVQKKVTLVSSQQFQISR